MREEYGGAEGRLTDDITRRDSIILNLQRACDRREALDGLSTQPANRSARACSKISRAEWLARTIEFRPSRLV